MTVFSPIFRNETGIQLLAVLKETDLLSKDTAYWAEITLARILAGLIHCGETPGNHRNVRGHIKVIIVDASISCLFAICIIK